MKYNKLEYNSAIFLSSISLFLGIGINRVISIAKNDSWISVIIGSILGLLFLYLFKKLKNKNRKWLSLLANTIILSIDIFLITKLISSIYLNKTPDFMVMLPFLIIIYYGVKKGFSTILKVSSILFFVYILITIIPVATLVPSINYDYFKPILNNSFINIIIGAIRFAIISISPILIFPDLKENFSYKSYIFSCLLLLTIIVGVIGNLGLDLSLLYRYPEYMVFKNISLMGFIENIQNILSYLWLISSFIIALFTSYNIKNTLTNKGLIIILISILFSFSFFLLNNYIYTDYLINYYSYILLTPIILCIFTKIWQNNKCLL